ncbi:spore gernimation protein GerPD [Paenibacillus piri]|uniref:Spore gernimation protein GerPD n=1 Tax=Paenibacillus piri TaxID=2547395 RepID=A0A4R5KTB8_9BACL|nr:spore gernimation protein GerPD [Paenibacillus piri]TDF98140.1 spore gernimation protein GerPD [Paenibacillus piri]
MNFQVTNKSLCVGDVRVVGVSSSSVFLIGDTEQIICSSIFDTPPESVIVGVETPLSSESATGGGEEGSS